MEVSTKVIEVYMASSWIFPPHNGRYDKKFHHMLYILCDKNGDRRRVFLQNGIIMVNIGLWKKKQRLAVGFRTPLLYCRFANKS